VNDLLWFFRRLKGKRAEETGETNNDGVKTGSQKQIATFEEQYRDGIHPGSGTFLLVQPEEKNCSAPG
jgi:hypothetical protein